ncbi:MAG: hypothetical protein CMD68_04930 [Gammaproteobacteria bacterium]|nr:hypothetical protein [Gammaproteobacteria bacterium]
MSITKEFPDHVFAWKVLGASLKSLGKNSEALEASQKAAMLSPNDPAAHNNLGIILKEFGKDNEAEASLRNAIALKSDFAEAHNNLGTTLKKLGRLDEARTYLKEAIALKSDFTEAHFNLGDTLLALDKCEEASVCFKQAIGLRPDFTECHFNLGVTLKKLGKLNEAEVSYMNAIKLNPKYPEALNNLGNILKELGRLDDAENTLRKAIMHKTNFPIAHNNLGVVLQQLGRLDEAEASYKDGIALQADYAEAYNNLGLTLRELGRLDEAEKSYKNAITSKADYSQAHQNLGIMLQELGRLDEAIDHFKLSDTDISHSYLLRCFYKLDQETHFYNQLNLILDQDWNNALIGSLISQSNIRYGYNKANPFCNEPLKYVYQTNLLERCDFETTFIKAAIKILNDYKVQYKSQGLLSNGIQTSGNLFIQSIETIGLIEKIIHNELENYKVNFKNSSEGFIKDWPKNYNLNGWLVNMKSGGELDSHMHERGWLSGSIYINVPKKLKSNSGNLVVGLGDLKNSNNDFIQTIDVVTGTLCLFPSSLHHCTIPFESSEDRIVLAFDVVPQN